MWRDDNPKRGKYSRGFLLTAWRANELHVRRCTSRGSYFHLFCLADKCRPALVRVPQRLFSKLCNFCWTHWEPINCEPIGKTKNKLLHLSKNCFAGMRLNAFSTFLEFAAVNGLDILTLTSISRCFHIWQRNDNLITYAAKCMSA